MKGQCLPIEAFRNMTFQHGLKQSARAKYSTMADQLQQCVEILARRLKAAFVFYKGNLPLEDLARACVDESAVKRVEYRVDCASNSALAYLGDAFLTLIVAKNSMELNHSPHQYQSSRSHTTSNAVLSQYYDHLIGDLDVVLRWDTGLSKRQKATFIEALIGLFATEQMHDCAEEMCYKISTIQ